MRPFSIGTVSVLYQARWVLPRAGVRHLGGGLLVDQGRVRSVLSSAAEVSSVRTQLGVEFHDLGSVALCPGLVNAHAHLELSGLGGRTPSASPFVPWVGAVLRERAVLQSADYARAVDEGVQELLATGTTLVGDVDSTGASFERLGRLSLRSLVYREVLDARDPTRTAGELERMRAPWTESERQRIGLSPHAPHTVSADLLRACVAEAKLRGAPLSIHWAETAEEREWMKSGGGPFASFLSSSPHCSGLQVLQKAGVFDARTSLVHGNCPEPHELQAVVRAGAVLVHCPGTHAFFNREPAPLEDWVSAGAQIALGTDSRASNAALDMRREMSLVRESHPRLTGEVVLDWATRGGAFALGWEREVGDLSPDKYADFVAFGMAGVGYEECPVDTITTTMPKVAGVWIGGGAI